MEPLFSAVIVKRRRRGSPHLQMNGTPNQEQFILDCTKVFETVRREGKGGLFMSLQGLDALSGSGGQTNMFLRFSKRWPWEYRTCRNVLVG